MGVGIADGCRKGESRGGLSLLEPLSTEARKVVTSDGWL